MKTPLALNRCSRNRGGFLDLRALIFGSGLVAAGAWLAPLASTFSLGGASTLPEYSGTSRDYLRVEKNDRGEATALCTSIVRLVPERGPGGTLVDLVSAVHVGDASYYATLDRQLAQYDAVLYELVAPEGSALPPSRAAVAGPQDPLAFIMAAGKRLFGFHGQLESMNYQQPNFVHADLSPTGMMQAWTDRGDNGLTIGLSAVAELVRAANLQAQNATRSTATSPMLDQNDILGLFTDANAPIKFKRMLAQHFDSTDVASGLGQTLSTILIDDRNAEVMRVLNEQIAQGKKKIAIFYGAAHMPDMEKRVMDLFKMKRSRWHWITAWDLKPAEAQVQPTLPLEI